MASGEELLDRLRDLVIAGDRERIGAAAEQALAAGMQPLEIIGRGLSPAMREVGERFRRYEVYLPEMMLAAEAWDHAMAILEPRMAAQGQAAERAGRVVIGTVKGDVHSLGKNIVALMLRAGAFEVVDLGVDVPASTFVTEARRVKADIIGASALMTTTMPQQKAIVDYLEEQNLRGEFKVIIGGGCTTEKWAAEIGADGYAETAAEGVAVALRLVENLKKGGGGGA